MLPKKFRVTPQGFYKRPSFISPLFSIRVRENGLSYTRFCVVVGKHVEKRAVDRNGLKRKCASCMEKLTQSYPGFDIYISFLRPLDKVFIGNMCEIVKMSCEKAFTNKK